MVLFRDTEDFMFFLKRIESCQIDIGFSLYSVCLMTNHFHLIIKDVGKNLPLIMDKIESVYAGYFNEKYKHKGSVFEGPFKSKPVYCDRHFLRLYRYIGRNPVAAHLVDSIYDYRWSALKKERDVLRLIDFDYIDEVFKRICKTSYEDYMNSEVDDLWVDSIEIFRMEDPDAEKLFKDILFNIISETEFNGEKLSKQILETIICISRSRGITLRQLTIFTGFKKKKICNLTK